MACIYGSDQCKICGPQPVADVAHGCTCQYQPQYCDYCMRQIAQFDHAAGREKRWYIHRIQPVVDALGRVVLPPWPNTSQQVKSQPETYATRRQRLAAERNPQPPEQWAWPDEPADERASGIGRAVANLNSHEHRLGSSRWEP